MTNVIDPAAVAANSKLPKDDVPGFMATAKLVVKAPFQGIALVGLIGGTAVKASWQSRGLMEHATAEGIRLLAGTIDAGLTEMSEQMTGGDVLNMTDEEVRNAIRKNWK